MRLIAHASLDLTARLGCLRKIEESILKCVAIMNECSAEVCNTLLSPPFSPPLTCECVQNDKLIKVKEQIDEAQSGIAESTSESRELEAKQLVHESIPSSRTHFGVLNSSPLIIL